MTDLNRPRSILKNFFMLVRGTMLLRKMKLIAFTAAVLLSTCKAAMTSLDNAGYDVDVFESANTPKRIDSKFKIRGLQPVNRYDVSRNSVDKGGNKLIGDPSENVASYLIFYKCPDQSAGVSDARMIKIASDDTLELSRFDITEIESHKFLSYHDQVRKYYRLQNADNIVTERGSEYWYSEIRAEGCTLSVLEAAAALNSDSLPDGNRYTEITRIDSRSSFINNYSPLKNRYISTTHIKLTTIPTTKRMCVGLVHEEIWGSSRLIFAHFTDGLSNFPHPGEACNEDFESPTKQIIYYQFDRKILDNFKTSAKVAGSSYETTDQFNTKLTALSGFLEHIKDPSLPEFNSLGIWHSRSLEVGKDITVEDVWSYEPIRRTVDRYHNTYRMSGQTRFFTKLGVLSTSPQTFIANVRGYSGPLCGVLAYIDTDANPPLLASHVSNGERKWSQTLGSCIEGFEYAENKLTIRAQKLTDSVKVGVQKDDDAELVFNLTTTGEEWHENFNLLGFVHGSLLSWWCLEDGEDPDLTFEIIDDAEDMTNVPTTACRDECDCRKNETCDDSIRYPPSWGRCSVITAV